MTITSLPISTKQAVKIIMHIIGTTIIRVVVIALHYGRPACMLGKANVQGTLTK